MIKKILVSIGTRLVTQTFLEWLMIWVAGVLVKKTDTPYDDELLAKIKIELGKA